MSSIETLAQRLATATAWARGYAETGDSGSDIFGTSTGAAAALVAQAVHEGGVAAIVLRGCRPRRKGSASSPCQKAGVSALSA